MLKAYRKIRPINDVITILGGGGGPGFNRDPKPVSETASSLGDRTAAAVFA